MSLQVWLPLNGDIKNQGLDSTKNPTLMGTGITWTAGKIGQAATFPNNCNSCIYLPRLRLQTGSLAAWIKVNGAGASARQCIISEGRDSYNDGVEFYTSQAGTSLSFKAHEKIISTTIELNQWYHVVGTFGNGEVKLYLNGGLKGTETYTADMTYQYALDLVLGKMSYSYTNTSNYFSFNGQLNDVRIYDHVLSTKEIEEIAKGLVLHYKLDNNGLGGTNLATNTTFPANNIEGYNGHKAVEYNHSDWTSGGRFFAGYSNSKLTFTEIVANQPYTISAWVYIYDDVTLSNPGGTSIFYRIYKTGDSPTYSYDIAVTLSGITQRNQWVRVSSTFTSPATYTYNQGGTFSIGGYNGHFLVSMPKVEKGTVATEWSPSPSDMGLNSNIIYDVSGYQNNGTLNAIESIADTARYSQCAKFNGSSSYVKVTENKWMAQHAREMTLNFWVKNSSWATNTHFFSCTETGGFNTEPGNSGYLRFPIYVCINADQTSYAYKYDSNEMQLSALPTNTWIMLTYIYTGSGTRTYINGQLHHTYNNTSYGIRFNTNARLFLGCEANTASPSSPYYNGQMSDFRIYYTALSQEQILELYNTSASIDNQGNIFTRELVEN